jgi:hypothetical protein
MSRLLLTSCLCLFATAAMAVPPVDKCSKIDNRTSQAIAPGRVAMPNAMPASAPATTPATATVASSASTDVGNHHAGAGATGSPHAAQTHATSPRWHSFLPGMFR